MRRPGQGEGASPPHSSYGLSVIAPGESLLAVFAHPDDESLAAGGLLAKVAASGARASVVTTTWAEGTHREQELAAALRHLDAGVPHLLGYADARVPESAPGESLVDAPLDEAVRRLVAPIRSERPDVVVTHDAYGGLTGHPDHVHTHRLAMLAVQAAGLGQMYRDLGEPWQPKAVLLATHPRSAVPLVARLFGASRAIYSVPDAAISETVDVGPWLDAKVAAILAHASEAERGAGPGVIQRMSTEDRATLLSTEWYIRWDLPAVGSAA